MNKNSQPEMKVLTMDNRECIIYLTASFIGDQCKTLLLSFSLLWNVVCRRLAVGNRRTVNFMFDNRPSKRI
jgi:hypothetical protein